ncbi:LysR family transcriptional regulator [Balneatrix alpica]|uniref:LysR family transcriptional regulator n=1 Tax=Balneatrix alpica TaxID=75684 RepID=A0ABV5ZFA5_9GAMM|nr:LysR family transcriptional regulator [Balneatrix alpica]
MRSNALPSLKALQVLEAVARLGSFSKAAEELCVSQGAISKQIKALEAHFQTGLLHRGKQVHLTQAGERLYQQLSEAFTLINQACGNIRPLDKISIKVPMTFADRWFIPHLRECEQQTGLKLKVASAFSYHVDFRHDEYDLAIGFSEQPGPWSLYQETLICVKSPDYPGPAANQSLSAWLAEAQLIEPSHVYEDWQRYLKAAGLDPQLYQRASILTTESMQSAIYAACAGQGITLVDKLLVQDELSNGRLVLAHDLQLRWGGNYEFQFAPHMKGSRELQVLFDWCKERLAKDLARI